MPEVLTEVEAPLTECRAVNKLETLLARVRETPLPERLTRSRSMIAKMCSSGRPPRMSIPVSHEDEDFFICATLDDAFTALGAADAEHARLKDLVVEAAVACRKAKLSKPSEAGDYILLLHSTMVAENEAVDALIAFEKEHGMNS